jgi:hypothetical protein
VIAAENANAIAKLFNDDSHPVRQAMNNNKILCLKFAEAIKDKID